MGQSQSRLDTQFDWEAGTALLPNLRTLMTTLENRFQKVEILQDDAATQADNLVNVGLKRINEVLLPSVERIQKLTSLGFLVAHSTSSVILSITQKTFILTDGEQRDLFTPSPFVVIEDGDDLDNWAVAAVLSYDAKGGVLVLDIRGVGTAYDGLPHTNWVISCSAGVSLAVSQASAAAVSAAASAAASAQSTAADAISTASDRASASASKTAAGTSATNAANSATAAAASAASADSQNRVSKAGDTMTGGLNVPAISIKGSSSGQLTWTSRSGDRDFLIYNTINALRVFNATDSGEMLRIGYQGDVVTAQLGDLKTYIDKGLRTDVAQAFTAVQKRQAKQNTGAFGTGHFGNISAETVLTSTAIGRTLYLIGSNYQVTLPAMVAGDVIYAQNATALYKTIKPNPGSAITYEGYNITDGTYNMPPWSSAVFTCYADTGSVFVFTSASIRSTPSVDVPQTFTDAQKQQLYANADIAIPQGQCRLKYVSATQIRLDPCDGNKIFINGNYRVIPATGVTISNAGLSAGTLYYVYAAWVGSPIVLQISTVAPVTDPTYGHKTANTFPATTLVGMVYVNSAGQFQDDPSKRLVASYFNRRTVDFGGIVATNVNVATSAFANLGTTYPVLTWEDEAIDFTVVCDAANTNAGYTCSAICNVDGGTQGQDATAHSAIASAFSNLTTRYVFRRSTGIATLGASGKVSGFNAAFYVQLFGTVRI